MLTMVQSFAIQCRVVELKFTNVSEEPATSISELKSKPSLCLLLQFC
jgi:hypothetical protein